LPLTTEHLTIPAGPRGPRAKDNAVLGARVTVSWQVATGSVLRAQQILAQLGFLPLQFSETGPLPLGPEPEVTALFHPPAGRFSWRYPNTPASLEQAWAPGVANAMTRGAIVAFERANRMVAYTTIRPGLWPALLAAEQAGTLNLKGYSYAMVSENQPESLAIWHNGSVVYRSVANTGLAADPTPLGTFFIYLRYRSQTMQGHNPNGSYYIDHGVRWVNYFDGSDAIHGFIRASYGFPQSLGCVELPVANAAIAWTWLHYGTLVTVSPPAPSA
jgi:lipoprotein-anchoring transpeptidase ErfK/SrfK